MGEKYCIGTMNTRKVNNKGVKQRPMNYKGKGIVNSVINN